MAVDEERVGERGPGGPLQDVRDVHLVVGADRDADRVDEVARELLGDAVVLAELGPEDEEPSRPEDAGIDQEDEQEDA